MASNILIRGIKIIEILALHGPINIEKIYNETKLSRSSIYRILCILEDLKYVTRYRDAAEDIWKLDYRLLTISSSILSRLDLRNEIRDILEELAEETKEFVQLGVLHNGKVLFLDVIKMPNSLINVANIGDEVDINISASGMALAAYLDENELDILLKESNFPKYTENTLTNTNEIKKELIQVRKRGFSYDNQCYAIGHRCIGAPIFDFSRKVIAALNISGHISTFSDEKIEELGEKVRRKAAEASKRLGYPVDQ